MQKLHAIARNALLSALIKLHKSKNKISRNQIKTCLIRIDISLSDKNIKNNLIIYKQVIA